MRFESIIFTILTTATALTQAAPVAVDDFGSCITLFEPLDNGKVGAPADAEAKCSKYWNMALDHCDFKDWDKFMTCTKKISAESKGQGVVVTKRIPQDDAGGLLGGLLGGGLLGGGLLGGLLGGGGGGGGN